MNTTNPYETPQSELTAESIQRESKWLARVRSGLTCSCLGLSALVPYLTAIHGLEWLPFEKVESFLGIFLVGVASTLVVFFFGAVAGIISPGRKALLATLTLLTVIDLFSLVFFLSGGFDWGVAIIYGVSAAIKGHCLFFAAIWAK